MAPKHACNCLGHQCNYWSLSCPTAVDTLTLRYDDVDADKRVDLENKKRKAMDPMHRRERGLLDYNTCRVDELRVFVRDRGLKDVPRRASKSKCRDALRHADDHQEFRHFMDLPPEIRVSIYKFHLAGLTKPKKPAQPPITRISRLVREESLPLFYENFSIGVSYQEHLALSGKTARPETTLSPDKYVKNLSAAVLGRATELVVDFWPIHSRGIVEWELDLEDGGAVKRRPGTLTAATSRLVQSVETYLSAPAVEMAARPKHERLRIGDLAAIEEAMQAAIDEVAIKGME